jgi:TrpR-related protein YerC/YecD
MDWNESKNKALVQAVLALRGGDEARRFLRDLLTPDEIEEFANRFRAAELLSQKTSYSKIEKETGLSSATVARVSKWLKGKEGGYRTIIARLHHHSIPLARVG